MDMVSIGTNVGIGLQVAYGSRREEGTIIQDRDHDHDHETKTRRTYYLQAIKLLIVSTDYVQSARLH